MTHLIETTKAEFEAIKGGVLPFYQFKTGDKTFKVGDNVIFQMDHEEHTVEVNNINAGEAVKAKWVFFSWKTENY